MDDLETIQLQRMAELHMLMAMPTEMDAGAQMDPNQCSRREPSSSRINNAVLSASRSAVAQDGAGNQLKLSVVQQETVETLRNDGLGPLGGPWAETGSAQNHIWADLRARAAQANELHDPTTSDIKPRATPGVGLRSIISRIALSAKSAQELVDEVRNSSIAQQEQPLTTWQMETLRHAEGSVSLYDACSPRKRKKPEGDLTWGPGWDVDLAM